MTSISPMLLDAFSHGTKLKLARHGHDRLAKRPHAGGVVDAANKALVDLHGVERQVLQYIEAGVACAKVVDRDANADFFQLAHARGKQFLIFKGQGLGHLQFQLSGTDGNLP